MEGKLTIVPLKTEGSHRTIDLPNVIVDALRAHQDRQRFERDAAGERWQEHGLVFTTSIGTPLDGSNVWRYFKRHIKRAGLPDRRFHDLRHTAASLLRAQGVPIAEVSKILGHSGIQITNDLYTHLYAERRREIADGMDAFMRRAR